MFLNSEKSVEVKPGPTITLRPLFPKVPGVGWTKQLVSKNRDNVCSLEGRFPSQTRFHRGKYRDPTLAGSPGRLGVNGEPLWTCTMPFNCQPPITRAPHPRIPLAKGISQVPLA